jgi:hypothetical protein
MWLNSSRGQYQAAEMVLSVIKDVTLAIVRDKEEGALLCEHLCASWSVYMASAHGFQSWCWPGGGEEVEVMEEAQPCVWGAVYQCWGAGGHKCRASGFYATINDGFAYSPPSL